MPKVLPAKDGRAGDKKSKKEAAAKKGVQSVAVTRTVEEKSSDGEAESGQKEGGASQQRAKKEGKVAPAFGGKH